MIQRETIRREISNCLTGTENLGLPEDGRARSGTSTTWGTGCC